MSGPKVKVVKAEEAYTEQREAVVLKLVNDALVCLSNSDNGSDVLNATSIVVVSVCRLAGLDLESFFEVVRDHWKETEGELRVLQLQRNS